MNSKNLKIIILIFAILIFIPIHTFAETYKTSLISVNERQTFKVGDVSFNDIYYQEYANNTFSLISTIDSNEEKNFAIKIYYYNNNGNIIGIINKNLIINANNNLYTITSNSNDLYDGYTANDIKYYMLEVNYTNDNMDNLTPSQNKEYSSLDYVIDKYNVDIIVNENNTLDITENISVFFNKEKHGIVRIIPYKNEIFRLNGTNSQVFGQISNIEINDNYTQKKENKSLYLYIGSKEKTKIGSQNYTIKYTYNLGKDVSNDNDELYFNIIGTNWDTVIGNVTFSITMPKDFDSSKLGFSSGTYGSTENDKINYQLDGNKIIGNYSEILDINSGITVRCELPEGYFVNEKYEIQIDDLILFIVPLIYLIISIMIWYFSGKDNKIVETVEFYPPENLNSLEIAYLYKGYITDEDVISLLIYLACKGYIKISEEEVDSLFSKQKEIKITYQKDYDGNNINEYLFLQGLFSCKDNFNFHNLKDNEVLSFDLYNSFYKTVDKIKSKMNNKENKNTIFEKNSLGKRKYIIFMMIISYLIINIYLLSDISNSLFFDLVFPLVGFIFMVKMFFGPTQTIYVNGVAKRSKILTKLFGIVFGILFGGIIWYNDVFSLLKQNQIFLIEYFWGLICILGMFICFKFMPKRTTYGLEVLGKINGFKHFLETAEKDKLNSLVNENPSYFYDILPYAYVLGVSNKWIKNFEGIILKAPQWYDSTDNFDLITSGSFINSIMHIAEDSMTSKPYDSSNSGGSSGGGSSGGGSSGGGSGGGGGSSW